jgi:hypothetical protein
VDRHQRNEAASGSFRKKPVRQGFRLLPDYYSVAPEIFELQSDTFFNCLPRYSSFQDGGEQSQ